MKKDLNLGQLMDKSNKVTLGFRCTANVKLELAVEAHELGLNLSEYVESLIIARKHRGIEDSFLRTKSLDLENRLKYYENKKLMELYWQNKGKNIEYKDGEGKRTTMLVTEPFHIFEIVMNSFKIN